MNYCDLTTASAFTVFVNNGGLTIPSRSVYLVVEYAEKVQGLQGWRPDFERSKVEAKTDTRKKLKIMSWD